MALKSIVAEKMTSREDTSVRGRLLGWAGSVAAASKIMRKSQASIKSATKGKKGWIALTIEGQDKPECCIDCGK